MGIFKFDDDPLKHFVRTDGWLPTCSRRRKRMRTGKKSKYIREPKYFTFCAVGAIDVLLLAVHNVIKPSENGFETVYFFDRDRESVIATQRRIPGATGFVGDFVSVVLADEHEDIVRNIEEGGAPLDPLATPTAEDDTLTTRTKQLQREELRRLISSFPFDVINLDIEEYVFRPREELPGKLLAAFRRILEWQRLPLKFGKNRKADIDEFSLLFTTKIGPPNLPEDYLARLSECVRENVNLDGDLGVILEARAGTVDIDEIRLANFELFFKIALPKILARTLMEQDWYVDPEHGIKIYEFQRTYPSGGSYTMLHFVMDIRRHRPPVNKRLPGEASEEAAEAYVRVIRHLFATAEIQVSDATIDTRAIKEGLEAVVARGKEYSQEP